MAESAMNPRLPIAYAIGAGFKRYQLRWRWPSHPAGMGVAPYIGASLHWSEFGINGSVGGGT